MNRWKFTGICFGLLIVLVAAVSASAEKTEPAAAAGSSGSQAQVDEMARADQLLQQREKDTLQQAIGLYETVLQSDSQNFEAQWKCAKAYREYGDLHKKQQMDQWKDICAQYGKKGMAYAQKAIEIAPEKPHGYLFYGLNVGVYSDGVGILKALKEGLKDKTQQNLEKAYKLDKSFEKGAPIVALGRFWQVVPWPFSDKDKAEDLYREFQQTDYYADNGEARVYLAQLLADKWGQGPKKEARRILQEVPRVCDDPYWQKKAQSMLDDL
ncbi:MAG: hypothetical protein ACQERN_13485 [Thermodesulfobacteriota bacterium]